MPKSSLCPRRSAGWFSWGYGHGYDCTYWLVERPLSAFDYLPHARSAPPFRETLAQPIV